MKTSKFFEFGFATKRDLQELSEAIKNAETIDGEVNTYADLPAPANHNGEIWLVKTTTGVVFVNKKVAGLYVSNGTTWAIITPVEIDGYQKLITTPTDGNVVITDANGQTQNGNKKLDDLAVLGETSSTAYRGDRGKIAYDHSQTTGNPHSTTKADVGLNNVANIDTTTTANITDSTDKRFVSDAEKTILSNTSGTNTGDQNLSGLMVKAQNLSDVANRQTSLNNITNISSATNEHVLTKDTATGNAIFKPSIGGSSTPATATTQGVIFLSNEIKCANNTLDVNNDIDFTAGNFTFSDNSSQAVVSAMTKRLDASWAAGTNQGGLDTGTKANSTWYYCYAIHNPTSSISDMIFSASPTTPTLPSGYTKRSKALFAFRTNSIGNIANGKWFSDRSFYYNSDFVEEQNINSTGSLVLTGVPLLELKAIMRNVVGASVVGALPIYSVGRSATNIIFVAGATNAGSDYGSGEVPISGNATIYRSYSSSGASTSTLYTVGYKLIN